MKLGIIADIHSNIAALDAALAALSARGAEKIACVGDIIGIGAHPDECVARISRLENLAVCVSGNHEGYFTLGIPARMEGEEAAFHRYEHALLSADSRAFLRSLPSEAEFCGAHFSHVAPTADVSRAHFFGHDHKRHIWKAGGRLYCDPGSLGCPGISSVARAAIFDTLSGDIETVDAPYDADEAAREIAELRYPAHATILNYFYGGRYL